MIKLRRLQQVPIAESKRYAPILIAADIGAPILDETLEVMFDKLISFQSMVWFLIDLKVTNNKREFIPLMLLISLDI